jgi:spore maturation protein SpmB
MVWLCVAGFLAAAGWYFFRKVGDISGFGFVKEFSSYWAVPALMGGLLLFGLARKVRVYESLVEGAKEGFQVTVRIIPYLVALFVAVGMFTASGAMDFLKGSLGKVTDLVGLPVELLPLAIIRPLSGSGSFSYMTSLFNQYGPDSFIGQMASVMQGSMDTTLYILAVYFGSVQVRKIRYALAAGLLADLGGIIAAVVLSHLFFK